MANFDAMVPLIPRDVRIPVDQERDQLRINQVEKTKEIEKVSDEDTNTIADNDTRRQQHQQHQQASSESGARADDEQDDGHIDTYA